MSGRRTEIAEVMLEAVGALQHNCLSQKEAALETFDKRARCSRPASGAPPRTAPKHSSDKSSNPSDWMEEGKDRKHWMRAKAQVLACKPTK
jgi:hypothetical protein